MGRELKLKFPKAAERRQWEENWNWTHCWISISSFGTTSTWNTKNSKILYDNNHGQKEKAPDSYGFETSDLKFKWIGRLIFPFIYRKTSSLVIFILTVCNKEIAWCKHTIDDDCHSEASDCNAPSLINLCMEFAANILVAGDIKNCQQKQIHVDITTRITWF